MTRSRPELDVSGCFLDPEQFPPEAVMNWQDLFGTERPVELEIGSGKGLFLANAASEQPSHHFFGIEIARKYARLAAERIVKAGLENVKIWPGDAGVFLEKRVPHASLRAVHVYFPDPWWKKRHRKRRVFRESLVASIVQCLEPGGLLSIASDVEEYFEVMTSLVAEEPRLKPLPPPTIKEGKDLQDYLTNFERKFRIEGRPIYRAAYQKQGKLDVRF